MNLYEETIKSTSIYKGNVTEYIVEEVRLPNGEMSQREIVRHAGASAVIPFTQSGEIVLVKQYRKAIDQVSIEIPAGIKDATDPDGLHTAKRELEEETDYNRIVCPIIEDSEEHQDESIKKAIDQVKKAYDSGQKVFFHCGGGSNRAGTVAVGTLLALGKADTIEQAEKDATAIRSKINVRPEFKESLKRIFPEA